MALNDNATLVIGAGNYFTAPTGTVAPTDLTAPDVAWENIGHTSLEDIMGFDSEGGETTVLGTLQNPSLRTSTSKRTENFTITIQQFDEDALKLYYGSNSVVDGDGKWLAVPGSPAPTVAAFLAIYRDGDKVFAIYAPKAEIIRGDNLEFADTESLAGMPLRITPVQHLTNQFPYKVTPVTTV